MAENRIRLIGGAGLCVASFALVAYGTREPNWIMIALGLAFALGASMLGASSLRPMPTGR
jgi:hypothetical protein